MPSEAPSSVADDDLQSLQDDLLDLDRCRSAPSRDSRERAAAPSSSPSEAAATDSLVVDVKAVPGPFGLRMTLAPRHLGKSVGDAVLAPFLRAYNARTGTSWRALEVVEVTLDG